MKSAMIWFDNDPQKTLIEKVNDAANYYRQKYKLSANLCEVHPSMVSGERAINGIKIVKSEVVLPNHLFVGVDDAKA